MKHISTCQVMWTNKVVATGYLKIHKSSISVLSMAKDWLSGAGSHRLDSWPLLIWRKRRCSRNCDIRALCDNATQLLWTRVTSSWERSLISMASARWSNCSHRKGINECSAGMFPQHVISRGGNVPWPARSPDLSACDYFLWGVSQKQSFHL